MLQSYQQKIYNTKISYRRHPTAKRTDSKLKKAKEKRTTPLTNSTVPYPPLQSQRERKLRTVPPPTPPKCPIKIVPARHSTQRRHTHEIYMTRLAREIPTDPAHPINKNRTYKDKHTPLTENQGTKREMKDLHNKNK